MVSAHGRNGAFVGSFPLSGGERGKGSILITVVGGLSGVRTVPVVTGGLLALQMEAAVAVVGTGLKPDGLAPITGMVAVGAKEKIGVWKAMLNRGSERSMLAGGERWSGDARGGVRGPYWIDVAGSVVGRAMEGGGRTFGSPS